MMKTGVTVAIINDSNPTKETIRASVASYTCLQLIAEGEAGEDVWPIVKGYQPDVLLLDMNMPQSKAKPTEGMYSSWSTISHLSEQYPNMTIVMHTDELEPVLVKYVTMSGERRCIFKSDYKLTEAVHAIATGEIYHAEAAWEAFSRKWG